jgi:hypothetical protein
MQDPAFRWLQAINHTHQKIPRISHQTRSFLAHATNRPEAEPHKKDRQSSGIPRKRRQQAIQIASNPESKLARRARAGFLGAHLGDGEAGCAEHARGARVVLSGSFSPLPAAEDSNGRFGKVRIFLPRKCSGTENKSDGCDWSDPLAWSHRTAGRDDAWPRSMCTWRCKGQRNPKNYWDCREM